MKPTASPNLWRPLRVTIFRNLLIADVISDAGAFLQNVGVAWLMVSLGAGPIYVALTQTAASLPYFLLALPIAGLMSPWILLVVDRNVPLVLFDPLTPDTVHASLLIFPELAKLANSLSRWVSNDLA
ncbi:MAG: MFS transporter [Terriglobales bacterium]